MCSHYEVPDNNSLFQYYGAKPNSSYSSNLWPGGRGAFLRADPQTDPYDDAVQKIEALTGIFGLLPSWVKDIKFARRTFNARSESVSTKPSFRYAWRQGQHCIIPATAIYEPDWRSGKSVATRITRTDGEPLSIAGLWDRWRSPSGEVIYSYTMLTINADGHAVMKNLHRPEAEKRMVVILPQSNINQWLLAKPEHSIAFLKQYPAGRLSTDPHNS
jgi:putative SOS response-associated peptidase YedK